ncbi:hypothetical protein ACP275_10G148400 [Erythranthe tilingii]
MATIRPSNLLFWSILAVIAATILVLTSSAAGDQPPEIANNKSSELVASDEAPAEKGTKWSGRNVETHVACMRRRDGAKVEEARWEEILWNDVCRLSFGFVGENYDRTGRLSEDYIEALRIYYNYNQTQVDISISEFAHRF